MASLQSSGVLLVEDDVDIQEVVSWVLNAEGYEVVLAPDGEAALEHLRSCPRLPNVILLDLGMPTMNGAQFRAEQRRTRGADIPVVIVSGDSQLSDKSTALGAAGYLQKPMNLKDLFAMVERFCRPVATGS